MIGGVLGGSLIDRACKKHAEPSMVAWGCNQALVRWRQENRSSRSSLATKASLGYMKPPSKKKKKDRKGKLVDRGGTFLWCDYL